MGINRRVARNNRYKVKKKIINEITGDLEDCAAIAEDYIPRTKRIEESLERLHNYFTTVEEDDERLTLVNSFLDVSKSLIPKMEDIYEEIIRILESPASWLSNADNRFIAIELINDFYICKIEMVELHKNFALQLEKDIFKGGN